MKKRIIHRGLSLIEASVVLSVIILMMVFASIYWKNSTDNMEYNSTATQLNTVTSAAVEYIHDNYAEISKNVSAGRPVFVSGQQLRDAGYLMSGYSLTNNSHQDYQVAIGINPAFSERLVAFVLTHNGTAIPYDGLRTITGFAGGMAGYVQDDNIAVGAFGGWKVSLPDYGMTAKAGHLASFISSDKLSTGSGAGDRLYRYSVDGHPALNQMKTAIDMNANNLNNAATVNTNDLAATNNVTTRNLTASDTINTRALTASDTINTNVLSAGDVTASRDITAGNNLRANRRLSGGEYLQLDAVSTAGAACPSTGLLSFDQAGSSLTCKNGIWTLSSSSGFTAPPAQTVSCTVPSGSNYDKTLYAQVDSAGQVYSRVISEISSDSTDWAKGTTRDDAIVTLGGLIGHGHTTSCSSGNNCQSTPAFCFASWTW